MQLFPGGAHHQVTFLSPCRSKVATPHPTVFRRWGPFLTSMLPPWIGAIDVQTEPEEPKS